MEKQCARSSLKKPPFYALLSDHLNPLSLNAIINAVHAANAAPVTLAQILNRWAQKWLLVYLKSSYLDFSKSRISVSKTASGEGAIGSSGIFSSPPLSSHLSVY